MSDLASELRQVADDAAHQARPLPAADVIRRGERRRRRTIVQGALGGLSAIGAASLAGVMIFTGAPAAANPAAAAGSAGTAPGTVKVAETASAAAGNITVNATYQVTTLGRVRILSVTYSGHVNVRISRAALEFEFQPPANHHGSLTDFAIVVVTHFDHGNFSGSVPVHLRKARLLTLTGNSTMLVHLLRLPPRAKDAKPATHHSRAILQSGIIFAASPR